MATKRKTPARKKPSSTPTRKAASSAPREPARKKQTARAKAAPRKKGATTTAMLQKVSFTMFHVSDATRARAFYEDVMGLKRGLSSPDGVWTEYDLPGGGCLALFRHPDPRFAKPAGGASIAFEVADLDALNERLVARGVTYQGDMVHGPNCRMSNILDSEGNGIILHQLNRKPRS